MVKEQAVCFIHALLHQIVKSLESKLIITTFLRTLVDGILSDGSSLNLELSLSNKEDPPGTIIRKILNICRHSSHNWDALHAVLDIEEGQKLSLIVDGLDIESGLDKPPSNELEGGFLVQLHKFILHSKEIPTD